MGQGRSVFPTACVVHILYCSTGDETAETCIAVEDGVLPHRRVYRGETVESAAQLLVQGFSATNVLGKGIALVLHSLEVASSSLNLYLVLFLGAKIPPSNKSEWVNESQAGGRITCPYSKMAAQRVFDRRWAHIDLMPDLACCLNSSEDCRAGGGTAKLLPRGWKQHFSRKRNRPYYVHAATGTSVWSPPTASGLDEAVGGCDGVGSSGDVDDSSSARGGVDTAA